MREKINEEIKNSLRSGDKIRLNLFRVIKGEMGRLEDGNPELSDKSIIQLLQKFKKNLESVNDEKSQQ